MFRKVILLCTLFSAYAVGTNASKMKDLYMKTNDAINYEMYENADLSVVSIANYKIGSTSTGKITVTADVTTKNPHNKYLANWRCMVFFDKNNEELVFDKIDCQ